MWAIALPFRGERAVGRKGRGCRCCICRIAPFRADFSTLAASQVAGRSSGQNPRATLDVSIQKTGRSCDGLQRNRLSTTFPFLLKGTALRHRAGLHRCALRSPAVENFQAVRCKLARMELRLNYRAFENLVAIRPQWQRATGVRRHYGRERLPTRVFNVWSPCARG